MSVSSKKRKRHEAWEESLGGAFPKIMVDDQHGGVWLMWVYHLAPFEVRVEIPLKATEVNCPWLYVDEECHSLAGEDTRAMAETQYGAMTRVRLMEAHQLAIVRNRETGLARLKEAATKVGLFGTPERRRCVITTWTKTTDDSHVG